MSTNSAYVPVQKGKHVRVWLVKDGFKPGCCPIMEGCYIPGEVDVSRGRERIQRYKPGRTHRGFDLVEEIIPRGTETISTSLTARLPAQVKSELLRLSQDNCDFDMVWAYGVCSRPDVFNEFDRIEVFEYVSVEQYTHDAAGTFNPDETSQDVNEVINLSARTFYDYVMPYLRNVGEALGDTSSITGCAICTKDQCKDCDIDGRIYVTGVVPTTLSEKTLYIIYSNDNGLTWYPYYYAMDDDEEFANPKIACCGSTVVVTNELNGFGNISYLYIDQEDLEINREPVVYRDTRGLGYGDVFNVGDELWFSTSSGLLLELNCASLGQQGDIVDIRYDISGRPRIKSVACVDEFVYVMDYTGRVFVIDSLVATRIDTPAAKTISDITDWKGEIVSISTTGEVYLLERPRNRWTKISQIADNTRMIRTSGIVGYVASETGVYISADAGCTWRKIGDTEGLINLMCIDDANKCGIIVSDDFVYILDKGLGRSCGEASEHPCGLTGLLGFINPMVVCEDGSLYVEINGILIIPDALLGLTQIEFRYTYMGMTTVLGTIPAQIGPFPIPISNDDEVAMSLTLTYNGCIYEADSESVFIPCGTIIKDGDCIYCENGDFVVCEEC